MQPRAALKRGRAGRPHGTARHACAPPPVFQHAPPVRMGSFCTSLLARGAAMLPRAPRRSAPQRTAGRLRRYLHKPHAAQDPALRCTGMLCLHMRYSPAGARTFNKPLVGRAGRESVAQQGLAVRRRHTMALVALHLRGRAGAAGSAPRPGRGAGGGGGGSGGSGSSMFGPHVATSGPAGAVPPLAPRRTILTGVRWMARMQGWLLARRCSRAVNGLERAISSIHLEALG